MSHNITPKGLLKKKEIHMLPRFLFSWAANNLGENRLSFFGEGAGKQELTLTEQILSELEESHVFCTY